MFTAFLLTSIFPLSRISFRGSHYHPLPDPVTITLPGKDFQPRKADMEREYDMPGADMETVRRAFFRPINVEREDPD